MEKSLIIGKIYKILPMKENLDKQEITTDEFEGYISKQYILFSGLDINDNIKSEILTTLRGIRNLYTELNVKEIRSSVLRLTNMIDREV